MPVAPLLPVHAPAIARLHAEALAGDFLPSLGAPFLQVFYESAIEKGLINGYVDLENEEDIRGFVVGSADTSILFRQVLINAAVALAWAALPAVVRRPRLLLKVLETFFYPNREAFVTEKAELLVIAVDTAYRGQRIGEGLVAALDAYFCQVGLQSYKVTVLQTNTGANRFYQRLGFRNTGEFTLYGKKWNLYIRSLDEEKH